jgi:hypothetical protein
VRPAENIWFCHGYSSGHKRLRIAANQTTNYRGFCHTQYRRTVWVYAHVVSADGVYWADPNSWMEGLLSLGMYVRANSQSTSEPSAPQH